jgi:hypothetical protein
MLALPRIALATALAAAILFVSGCSLPANSPAGDASTVKASEPTNTAAAVTAKTAYWEMYKSAYKWAPDLVLLKLVPKQVAEVQTGAGNVGIWEGTFGSPKKHECRVFTYSTTAHPPDIYAGVTVGNAMPWSGVSRDVMPIIISEIAIDSDAAYATATKDGAAWLKKNPDKKLTHFQLGNGYSFPAPVWYTMWGDEKNGYVAYINAINGSVLKDSKKK